MLTCWFGVRNRAYPVLHLTILALIGWALVATWREVAGGNRSVDLAAFALLLLAAVGVGLIWSVAVAVAVDEEAGEAHIKYPFRPRLRRPLRQLERVGRGPLGSGVVVLAGRKHLVAAGDSKGFVEFARSCHVRLGVEVDNLEDWPQGLPLTSYSEHDRAA